MTTQAQIEEAARAMFELEYKLMGSDWVIPKWDESYRSYWEPLASAALAAAAEVGDGNHERADEMRRLFKSVANHTIERCARVAENMDYINRPQIAAAIRALKDKP